MSERCELLAATDPVRCVLPKYHAGMCKAVDTADITLTPPAPPGLDFEKAEADRHAMDLAAGQRLGSGRVPDYETHQARWRAALNAQHLAALALARVEAKRETVENIVDELRDQAVKAYTSDIAEVLHRAADWIDQHFGRTP